jgi:hypothetical protein
MSEQQTKETRVLWTAWSDEDGGYLAALYGSTKTEQQMVERIKQEHRGKLPELRAVRIEVSL